MFMNERAARLHEEGQELSSSGNDDEALRRYHQALVLEPDRPTTLERRKGDRRLFRERRKGAGPISRRVAGIWFIGFLRSVSFVWFDERERQYSPAHQLDCL